MYVALMLIYTSQMIHHRGANLSKFHFGPTHVGGWTSILPNSFSYPPPPHTHTHQGIGDSAQGFANSILFVVFTRRVRQTVFNLRYWRGKLCRTGEEEYEPLMQQSMKVIYRVQQTQFQKFQGRAFTDRSTTEMQEFIRQ